MRLRLAIALGGLAVLHSDAPALYRGLALPDVPPEVDCREKLWIGAVVDGDRLAGYAIFDRRDNVNFGLKRVRLVDFQSLDGTTALLAPILSWALRKCRDEGIHMLENIGQWLDKGELIDNVAPHRRKLSTWTYVCRANSPNLGGSLRDRDAWSPSLFDASASL